MTYRGLHYNDRLHAGRISAAILDFFAYAFQDFQPVRRESKSENYFEVNLEMKSELE